METQILNDLTKALNYWGVDVTNQQLAAKITEGKPSSSSTFAERMLMDKKISCQLYPENRLVVQLKESGIFSTQLSSLEFQATKPNKRRMEFQPGDWVITDPNRKRKLLSRKKITTREIDYFEEAKQIEYVMLGVGELEVTLSKFNRGNVYVFADYFGPLKNQMVRLAKQNEIKKVKMKNLFQQTEQRGV